MSETAVCPKCGYKFKTDIVTEINAGTQSEIAKSAENGDIFKRKCGRCGGDFFIAHPCLYYCPEKKFMVYLAVSDIVSDRISELTEARGCKLRVVKSVRDFIEKIYVLKNMSSDMAVEIVKALVKSRCDRNDIDYVCFDHADDDSVYIATVFTDGSAELTAVKRSVYAGFAATPLLGLCQDTVIDEEWAKKFLK